MSFFPLDFSNYLSIIIPGVSTINRFSYHTANHLMMDTAGIIHSVRRLRWILIAARGTGTIFTLLSGNGTASANEMIRKRNKRLKTIHLER